MKTTPLIKAFLIVGLPVALLIGCVTTEQQLQPGRPGALPQSHLGADQRLNASTYLAHGHLLERQGEFAHAAEQYRQALELMPDSAPARTRLGITLNKLGQHAAATTEFRKALLHDADNPTLLNNLGFSLYLEGELLESERVLKRVLELEPMFARARMNHAIVQAKLGQYNDALADFRLAGTEADAYYNVAVLQADGGLYADAARSLELALQANPQFDAARQQLRQISRLAAAQEAEIAAQEALAAQMDADLARQLAELRAARAKPQSVRMAADLEVGPTEAPPAEPQDARRSSATPPKKTTFKTTASVAQHVWLWNQIEKLLTYARTEPQRILQAHILVRAVDDYINAFLENAPWEEACWSRLERILGEIECWDGPLSTAQPTTIHDDRDLPPPHSFEGDYSR